VIVTNCDALIKADYARLVRFHRDDRNKVTLVASVRSYPIPYGICEIDSTGRLTRINEKPEFKFLVNTGMYVVDEEALRLIPEDQVFHVTDLVALLTRRGERVGVFPVGEKSWSDTGEWAEYKKTLSQLTLTE
jgi:NDP-sugar pyrophosphorylase family protein